MKNFWLLLMVAVFVVSCSEDSASSPKCDEYCDEESSVTPEDSTGNYKPSANSSNSKNPKGSSDSKSPAGSADSSGVNNGNSANSADNTNGSNSSNSVNTGDLIEIPNLDTLVEDTSVVTTKTELPQCTSANEGESFMVDEENTLYFCINEEWRNSIDVLGLVKASCENGVLTVDPFAASDIAEEVDATLEDTYRRIAAPIAGVAQKGPFRFGATVKIVELDSALRMADSKRAHESCLASSDGSYSFPGVNLVSPYVRVEVTGYFRNELTGGLSTSMVTLHSITDLTERDTVNINMLTYLEAPRVMKLVENSGFNQPIRMVKAQALKDILFSFDINIGGSANSGGNGGWFFGNGGAGNTTTSTTESTVTADEVSLFGGDDYSAALLAVSIMMQRRGSGSEMLSYASEIAERIKGNGNWDDNNAKADLADWLMELDASGGYDKIRKTVESWGTGKLPDFEQHLRNFWAKAYGFETCNAMTAGQVKNVNTSLSAYFAPYYDHPDSPKIRFICDASMGSWRVATDIEKDTVGYGPGEYDGQIRGGLINTDIFYIYEQKNGYWRVATAKDVLPFEDIKDVYDHIASDETVVFVLRHAERGDDTGRNGHLTDNGKAQSASVGEKFKGAEIYFGNSGYTRTKETCENIGKGSGMSVVNQDSLPFLDGDWFIKDNSKFETYKNSDGGGWSVVSRYAYRGGYTDAFYDLETRSKELINDYIIANLSKMKRVNFLISHDQMVLPLTVYCTEKRVNLRYFDNQTWINYLAGVAIIVNSKGDVRYEPVRGIESGTMKL